jgi:hydrogenase/urease accessory protein HupE
LTLAVTGTHVDGRWDIALRDLANAIDLDADGNGAVTWGELRAREGDVDVAAIAPPRPRGGRRGMPSRSHGLKVASHSDGTYAVSFRRRLSARRRASLDVDYSLFFDVDPQHRGIVRDRRRRRDAHRDLFTARPAADASSDSALRPMHQLGAAIRLGVGHIFAGIDHLCFLVALLLPSVLVRHGRSGWSPVTALRPALVDVLKIVTAFTLAHSITLTLSALEVLRSTKPLVESGIAASVVVAAVNNVVPVLAEDRWTAAFALGLLHGFGFSATLMDLGLPRKNLALTLFGFNVGVEIGQMCVVAAFVPLAYLARRTWLYQRVASSGVAGDRRRRRACGSSSGRSR